MDRPESEPRLSDEEIARLSAHVSEWRVIDLRESEDRSASPIITRWTPGQSRHREDELAGMYYLG